MKPLLCFFISCWLVATGAYAADRYDRNIICKDLSPSANCALHIEQAIAKDVPGVIQRTGLVLTIKAKNGKQIKRKDSPPPTHGADGVTSVRVCGYLPGHDVVQLCHYLNEGFQTEYIQISNGNSIVSGGHPVYSPSKNMAVMISMYYLQLTGIEILRFERNKTIREFQYVPSSTESNISFSNVSWQGEDKIVFSLDKKPSHTIEKNKKEWVMREL